MGSADILPTRPFVDPFEVTQPMDKDWSGSASTPSDWSGLLLSPYVIKSTLHHASTPEPLQKIH